MENDNWRMENIMKNLDILTIGNATVDAFLSIHDAHLNCRIDEKTHELCVQYGQKIMVDSCVFQTGGNAVNVAVGLSRLGFVSSICAEIGDDEFAQKISKSLNQENIDQSYLIKTPGTESSFAVGINVQAERTLFVKHSYRKHEFRLETLNVPWIFLTSLGEEWEHVYKKVVTLVQENNINLAFNPGSHQLEKGLDSFRDVLAVTKILFVNKEEAIRIFNFQFSIFNENKEKAIKELLEKLHQLGPEIVVMTDGKNGSYVRAEDATISHLGIFPHPVVERTGAGDAYTTGFIAAIMQKQTIPQAMRWGTVNAASVIGQIGAQAGLLNKETLPQKLTEHNNFLPEVIV